MQPNPAQAAYLASLQDLDPRFLDPNASFVVLPETAELDVSEVRLSLEGLAAMMDHADNLNARLRHTGGNMAYGVEIPTDSLGAIFRILSEKLASAKDLPTLSAMHSARPELFNHRFGGV